MLKENVPVSERKALIVTVPLLPEALRATAGLPPLSRLRDTECPSGSSAVISMVLVSAAVRVRGRSAFMLISGALLAPVVMVPTADSSDSFLAKSLADTAYQYCVSNSSPCSVNVLYPSGVAV